LRRDVLQRLDLRVLVVDGACQKFLGARDQSTDLVGQIGLLAADQIGANEVAIDHIVERFSVADQHVDRPVQLGGGTRDILKPDRKIVRAGWNTMLRHQIHRLACK